MEKNEQKQITAEELDEWVRHDEMTDQMVCDWPELLRRAASTIRELQKRAVPEVPPEWYPDIRYYRLDGGSGQVSQAGYQRPPTGSWECRFKDRCMRPRFGEGATAAEAIRAAEEADRADE